MNGTKRELVRRALDEILDVLARHGEVRISARVGGAKFEIRVRQDKPQAPARPRKAPRARTGERIVRGARNAKRRARIADGARPGQGKNSDNTAD